MDKNIPLSELIRIGSRLTRQCRGMSEKDGKATCALGAALTAKRGEFISDKTQTGDSFIELGIRGIIRKCPIDGYEDEVGLIIFRLNDIFTWTREQIADWLESIGL